MGPGIIIGKKQKEYFTGFNHPFDGQINTSNDTMKAKCFAPQEADTLEQLCALVNSTLPGGAPQFKVENGIKGVLFLYREI